MVLPSSYHNSIVSIAGSSRSPVNRNDDSPKPTRTTRLWLFLLSNSSCPPAGIVVETAGEDVDLGVAVRAGEGIDRGAGQAAPRGSIWVI